MNFIQKILIKKKIRKLSHDKNYHLSLDEIAKYQKLLLEEGINLSLVMALLGVMEITYPQNFNFTLSPEFVEREKLVVKSNPSNNFFFLKERYEDDGITEEEKKELDPIADEVIKHNRNGDKDERKHKPDEDLDTDDGGEHSDLTDTEQEFISRVENASKKEVKVVKSSYGYTDNPTEVPEKNEDDEVDDKEIFDHLANGDNDPVSLRVKEEQERNEGVPEPDYERESEN